MELRKNVTEDNELPKIDGIQMHAELTNPNTRRVIREALDNDKSITYVFHEGRVFVYCH